MGCGVNVEFDRAQRPRRTYAAVKAAIVEMRLILALALHPIGVTVNAVGPRTAPSRSQLPPSRPRAPSMTA
jgi:NAD(P)-dependent dehydrogenase (short-subunit alcohol dehydrogenase family)